MTNATFDYPHTNLSARCVPQQAEVVVSVWVLLVQSQLLQVLRKLTPKRAQCPLPNSLDVCFMIQMQLLAHVLFVGGILALSAAAAGGRVVVVGASIIFASCTLTPSGVCPNIPDWVWNSVSATGSCGEPFGQS